MSSPTFSLYTTTPSKTSMISLFSTPHQYSPPSPSPLSWSYSPQTPSPLQTSRNANLMPPPPLTKSSPLASVEDRYGWGEADEENTSIFSPTLSTSASTSKHNPFAPSTISSTSTTSTTSTFARRARSQSPVTELGSRTSAARDRRKSLFLEQIRSKREDTRFEARGEKVLRMDWEREERARRESLRLQAQRLGLLDIEPEDENVMLDMQEQEEAGLSPTEEHEIEELVRLHEDSLQQQQQANEEDLMIDDLELNDEEYDRLFREAMESTHMEAQANACESKQDDGSGWAHQQQQPEQTALEFNSVDEAMDMS